MDFEELSQEELAEKLQSVHSLIEDADTSDLCHQELIALIEEIKLIFDE